jgi:hypothetical protein
MRVLDQSRRGAHEIGRLNVAAAARACLHWQCYLQSELNGNDVSSLKQRLRLQLSELSVRWFSRVQG